MCIWVPAVCWQRDSMILCPLLLRCKCCSSMQCTACFTPCLESIFVWNLRPFSSLSHYSSRCLRWHMIWRSHTSALCWPLCCWGKRVQLTLCMCKLLCCWSTCCSTGSGQCYRFDSVSKSSPASTQSKSFGRRDRLSFAWREFSLDSSKSLALYRLCLFPSDYNKNPGLMK